MSNRAFRLVALLTLWGAAAAADDWVRLDGPGIRAALTSRVLGYPDGLLQDFKADGTTILGYATGRWRVQGDRLCTKFAQDAPWLCATVERVGSGLDIRFTGEADRVTVGRYVDLR